MSFENILVGFICFCGIIILICLTIMVVLATIDIAKNLKE